MGYSFLKWLWQCPVSYAWFVQATLVEWSHMKSHAVSTLVNYSQELSVTEIPSHKLKFLPNIQAQIEISNSG